MTQILRQSLGQLGRQLRLVLILPALLLAGLLLALNTDSGRGLLVWGLEGLTAGRVTVTGPSGRWPLTPRIERLELRDDAGVWLRIEDAALDLNPWPLLRGEIAISALSARSLVLERLPKTQGGGAGQIRSPLGLRVEHLRVADLVLDPAIPGAPRLALEGGVTLGGGGAGLEGWIQAEAAGRSDRYRLDITQGQGGYRLGLSVGEDADGLVPALAKALDRGLALRLGAWRLDAEALGPPEALTLTASFAALEVQASARGTLDLRARSTTGLRLGVMAPALSMATPGGIQAGWGALALVADLSGPWDAPRGRAWLDLEDLLWGGLSLRRLTLAAQGDHRGLGLSGSLRGPRGPMALPASALDHPWHLAGALDLADPRLPFALDLAHPLLGLAATGGLRPATTRARLGLPDLGALGSLAGLDLEGSARLDLTGTLGASTLVEAKGLIQLARAPGPLAELLGPEARLRLAARQEGSTWRLDSMALAGAHMGASARGSLDRDRIDLGWAFTLPDLGALAPKWTGRLESRGRVSGPPGALGLVAEAQGLAVHQWFGEVRLEGQGSARLADLDADLDLRGDWAGEPLRLRLATRRPGSGPLEIGLTEARWASVSASGRLALRAGSRRPSGEIRFVTERLADLAPLISLLHPQGATDPRAGLGGRLEARLQLADARMRIDALGEGLSLPGPVGIGALALDAEARDPWGAGELHGRLEATGLALGTNTGSLSLSAQGALADLGLKVQAALDTPLGATRLGLEGRLDTPHRRLSLESLEAQVLDQGLRLLSPARLDLGGGRLVDPLRLGIGGGSSEITGRLIPPVDLEARLHQIPLDLVALAAPDLPLAGTLAGEIRLAGPPEALMGSVELGASRLRLTEGAGRGLPPAEVRLAANLGPDTTRLNASVQAGEGTRIQVQGTAGRPPGASLPLGSGPLDLRAEGHLDLALLDPLLSATGRQAQGQVQVDARLTGTRASPSLNGGLRLSQGALWDRRIGLVLTQIQGRLALTGDTVQIETLSAKAGPGALDLAGRVGLLAPGVPVDLRLRARDARPLQRDALDVQGDADLRLIGEARGRLSLAGRVHLDRVEISLPERLPANLRTLEVREVGERRARPQGAPRAAPQGRDLDLDLVLSAPADLVVRGRGVDAELGGEVRLQGTLADPLISGGFDLRRGDYALVGQTLHFSRGRLGFDGAAGLNPSLDLEARVTAAGATAILAVQGTALAPSIDLRGEPEMPQDEVLSRLLFGVAGGRLSPWQATRLGLAAASLAGIPVEGPGVLDRVRRGLGLDQLRLGTEATGGTGLAGGRQLSERVYLGARQGTRAGEPQGVLRIEVSPRIQLEADVGPIGGTRAGAAFEIEY